MKEENTISIIIGLLLILIVFGIPTLISLNMTNTCHEALGNDWHPEMTTWIGKDQPSVAYGYQLCAKYNYEDNIFVNKTYRAVKK